MAETGKTKTYSDAIEALLSKSVIARAVNRDNQLNPNNPEFKGNTEKGRNEKAVK